MSNKITSVHVQECYGTHKRPKAYQVQVYVDGYRVPFYIRLVKLVIRSALYPDRYDYAWTSDYLYAFKFNKKTAERHAAYLLEIGAI